MLLLLNPAVLVLPGTPHQDLDQEKRWRRSPVQAGTNTTLQLQVPDDVTQYEE